MKKKGDLAEEYLVQGLVHLAKVGEDINWTDSLYVMQNTSELIEVVRILLQCELSRSEICLILRISDRTLDNAIGEEGLTL